jgi:DNA-binding transcriptional LysR family regulator
MTQPELRHLRYFAVLAEELHFGRAAARLGIAQPPLSIQIGQLERLVGARLLERRPQVRLTRVGETFLAGAKAALSASAEAVSQARSVASGRSGLLRIGFSTSVLVTFIPDVIRAFRALHPQVDVRLQELDTADQLALLEAGQIDIGFAREPSTQDRSLDFRLLVEEPFVLVLPPQHRAIGDGPIDLAEVAAEPFVLIPGKFAAVYLKLRRNFEIAGFQPNVALETDGWFTILGLVNAGVGLSLVPASFQRVAWGGLGYRSLTGSGDLLTLSGCVPANAPAPAASALLAMAEAAAPLARLAPGPR